MTLQSQVALTDKEFFADLRRFESSIADKKSAVHDALASTNRDIFLRWEEKLETGINAGFIKNMTVKKIAEYVRHKLIDWGLQDAIPYMYEVTPSKYKEHRPNHDPKESDKNTSLNILIACANCGATLKPTLSEWRDLEAFCEKCHEYSKLPDFTRENKRPLHLATLWRKGIDLWEQKLRSGPWESKILSRHKDGSGQFDETEEEFQKRCEDYEQTMIVEFAAVLMMHEFFDDRQGVPINTQHMLKAACLQLNTNDAGSLYFDMLKEKNELTRKRTTQIVEGLILSCMGDNRSYDFTDVAKIKGKLHIMLEPTDRENGRRKGFTGHTCEQCGALRMSRRYHNGSEDWEYCWACHAWQKAKSDDLYANPAAKEVTSYTCESCHHKGIITAIANRPQPK